MLPISSADQRDGGRALSGVGGVEVASDDGLDPEHLQELGSDAGDHGARGLRASRDRDEVGRIFRDRLEAAALVAEVVEVGVGQAVPYALRSDLKQGDDAVGITVG